MNALARSTRRQTVYFPKPGRPGEAPWPGLLSAVPGATGMAFVGASVGVSGVLRAGPYFTAEAVRYGAACLLLIFVARLTGQPLLKPRNAEWLWLMGISLTGQVIFNIALVQGARHAEPAVLGVAVAAVPAVLAVLGPIMNGSAPRLGAVVAALVVTLGAALVEGTGRSDGVGLLWAAAVFVCEACFTLLAVPVLPRLGAWDVSVHATWLAAVCYGSLGLFTEGPFAISRLSADDWAVVAYLAVAVTAIAFVLWFSSVRVIGAGRAGLLTGIAPISAAGTGVLLGRPLPHLAVWAGILTILVGLALGFSFPPKGPRCRPQPDGFVAPAAATSPARSNVHQICRNDGPPHE